MSEIEIIERARTAMAVAKAEGAKAVKAALAEHVKPIFEAHPTIEAVGWRQYTPYFNDGDACVFGLHGAWTQVDGEKRDEYDFEKGDPIREVATDFEEFLSKCEEFLQDAFGDHAEVSISRDLTVDVDEYNHD